MASGNYYDQSEVKGYLNIEQSTTKYDEVLDKFGEAENRETDDIVSAYAGTVPLTGDLLTSARNRTNYAVCAKFKLRQNDFEMAREWRLNAKQSEDKLIQKLQTDPATNTQSQAVAYSSSYKTEPIKTRTS